MSTKYEAYLLYVQSDSCVCAQPTAVWFQRQNDVFPKAKDTCISVFLLWGKVNGRAKQLCALTIGLHCPIPAALTVFPLGLVQLSFYSVKCFPWVQGELDQERQSQFINWGLTCLYSYLKGSEFMGKAPCWLQRIVEQMQTPPNNSMSHLWQQTPHFHPCLDEGDRRHNLWF